jgi:integrase
VKDFRRAWWKLIAAAGLPNLLVHDLRRSAARSYRRAGFPESVIMKIGGWKTRTVFERYNVTNNKDVAEAVALREQKRIAESEIGHDSPVFHKRVEGKKTVKAAN